MKDPNYGYHTDISCNFKQLGLDHGLEVRFMPDSCCFTCGHPGDLCESYRKEEKCQMGNFIVQRVGQALQEASKKGDRFDKIFGCIEKVSQRIFDYNSQVGKKDMTLWFGQKGRWEDINCSNVFSVFCEAIGMGIII
jgi:hypothetical protein